MPVHVSQFGPDVADKSSRTGEDAAVVGAALQQFLVRALVDQLARCAAPGCGRPSGSGTGGG